MRRALPRVAVLAAAAAVAVAATALGAQQMQPWNNSGLAQGQTPAPAGSAAPAPRRDLTGTWDAGGAGIGGPGHVAPPFTPEGQKLAAAIKPGNGPRIVHVSEINDPLSTIGDPAGFPRNLLFELRPVQIVHTPDSVLMLYMFEKR